MEMPRSFSIDIQSEVTPRRPALPCTAPAVLIAAACSASASGRVDLPASGWLITANVRRRRVAASSRTSPLLAGRFSTSVTDTAAALLTQGDISDPNMEKPRSILPNGCVVPRPAQHGPESGRRKARPAHEAPEGGLSNSSAYPRAANRGPGWFLPKGSGQHQSNQSRKRSPVTGITAVSASCTGEQDEATQDSRGNGGPCPGHRGTARAGGTRRAG